MTKLTTEQLNRIFTFYAAKASLAVDNGGTNLLIAAHYLSEMQDVLNALSGNEMNEEWLESGLRVLELIDILLPQENA